MTDNRAGRSGLGCLASIVLLVLIGYLGTQFIPPYMRYEQFLDSMRSNARFATTMADSTMRNQLIAQADTLGLPVEAKHIVIRRQHGPPATISISSQYIEIVKLPVFGIKLLHYKPSAEAPL
jgi:hypothetical protein